MAKSLHVAAISVHFASLVEWDDFRLNVARSQYGGSMHGVSHLPRTLPACCEWAVFGRNHPMLPMEATTN